MTLYRQAALVLAGGVTLAALTAFAVGIYLAAEALAQTMRGW